MGREIEVQTDALISLASDYKRYGQNIYSRYRTGASRIDSELSSILRKYSDYSSVTSKVYSIQSKLRQAETHVRKLEEKSSKISNGLTAAARSYASSDQEDKNLIGKATLHTDHLSSQRINNRVGVAINVDYKQGNESIGDKIGDVFDGAVDKIKDAAGDAIHFVNNFDLGQTIEGIGKKFGDTVSNIKESVSKAASNIETRFNDFKEQVKGTFVNFTNGVKEKWDSFKSGVSNFFKKAKDTLADCGKKLVAGMKDIADQFTKAVGKTIDYIIEHKDVIINGLKKVGVFLLDGTQFILDIVGLIPGVGELADGLNGLIYLARGDLLNAGLSFAACIPFAGWAATGGKIFGKIAKVIDKIGDVSKIVDKVKDLVKYLDKAKDLGKTLLKHGDDALKFIMTKGDNVISFITKKGNDLWNFISHNKIYNKAADLVNLISKKGEVINSFLAKQADNFGLGVKEWWERQCRTGIVPPEFAEWINKGFKDKLKEDVIEDQVEKEIKEEVIEGLSERAFKELDLKDIDKVVEEGDILKVKLKDGTELTYKKADLSPDELKELEDANLIEKVKKTTQDLVKESECSTDDLITYLKYLDTNNAKRGINSNYADEFAKTGKWPSAEEAQIPKNKDVLVDSGDIDWNKAKCGGYTTEVEEVYDRLTGKVVKKDVAIRNEFTPDVGEIIDRYGPSNGRYTSPTKNGNYTYEQRSLPYLEDASKYHQYKVEKDFSKLKEAIEDCTDASIKTDINNIVKNYYKGNYSKFYENLKAYQGEIAPAFGSTGGGIQYELPLSVDLLEKLGFLSEMK